MRTTKVFGEFSVRIERDIRSEQGAGANLTGTEVCHNRTERQIIRLTRDHRREGDANSRAEC